MITKLKLDRLAELLAEIAVINIEKKSLINGVMTAEIKEQIADIEEEFKPRIGEINQKANDLEKRIKEEVIVHGETIKGNLLQAVWSKARTSWDTKGLNGYLVNNPELNQFKKIGKPSVSIRKVG